MRFRPAEWKWWSTLVMTAALVVGAEAQLPLQKSRHRVVDSHAIGRALQPFTVPSSGAVNIDITSAHVLRKFVPNQAFGASVDAIGSGSESTLFSNSNVSTMLGAGQGGLSYRLYTELNVEDWHWNPIGTWSDAKDSQGYFVGSSTIGSQIQASFGYALPHRGATYDYGSNLQYSNIDDGNLTTYWKSNPYLTSTYTHESDSMHPQWIVFVLSSIQNINAVQVHWANPYAVSYQVQRWTGNDPIFAPTEGAWVNFPMGVVTNGVGGTTTLKLSTSPIPTQFVRILMTQSSNTYDTHGNADARNKMGYAVYEAGIGSVDGNGNFTDYVQHLPSQNQTTVYVSSTDPWHSPATENSATEQIGLDSILTGKLAQKLPAMIPVPMTYSTPDNAAAEVTYLLRRHYPIAGIELGEEPDGQNMLPEDYGALFVQWAAAIHRVDPLIKVGGPVTSFNGVQVWPDATGDTDFLKRFVNYLKSHNAISSLGFVSTEHYPFYQAGVEWPLVNQEVSEVQSIFKWISNANVAKTIPVYVTEYNLSAAPAQPIVDLMGALWHAVFVGEFMKGGGAGSYFYQYLPYEVSSGGTSFGLIGMLESNDSDQVIAKTSQYFSSQLMNLEWCLPGSGTHSMLPATTTLVDSTGVESVLPYAVARPDGQYSVMLINTDSVAHYTTISFKDTRLHAFTGSVTQSQLSPKNYDWLADGLSSTATPDGPYNKTSQVGGSTVFYSLPAHSLTVLRGKIH